MQKLVDKSVNLDLVGTNGNAFALMGAFQRQARHEGWTPQEINTVLEQAKSGDYNHLLATLLLYCESRNES